MEIVMGTKVVIVGDIVDPEERSLIVMNHRTRLDWNFLWGAMFHGTKPAAHRLKFVLKSAVRHFPGLGKLCTFSHHPILVRLKRLATVGF